MKKRLLTMILAAAVSAAAVPAIPSVQVSAAARSVSEQSAQRVQNILLDIFDTFQTKYDFTKYHLSVSDFHEILSTALDENPRYFYVSGETSYRVNSKAELTEVSFSYKYSKEKCSEMLIEYDKAVATALSGVNPLWSDLEKALYLNDYLTLHSTYDTTFSRFTAYNNLVEGNSVCQGYALAYHELLSAVGIPSKIVSSESLNHAWNMLLINGKYYYNDVTWNDPVDDVEGRAKHSYFLKSESFYRSIEGGHLEKDDWIVSGDWNIHDASDTSYDNSFWNEMSTPFQYVNGKWYNFDGTDSIKQYTYRNGQLHCDKTIVTISDIWKVPNKPGYYWDQKPVGFTSYGSSLYYSTSDKIYRLDPVTNTTEVVYTLTAEEKASVVITKLLVDAEGRLCYVTSADMITTQKQPALQPEAPKQDATDQTTCYRIHFNGNGADEGLMNDLSDCLADKTYHLSANTFSRSGYTFTGWNTKADGSGISYADKDTVTNLSRQNYGSITLYAQWQKKQTDSTSDKPSKAKAKISLSAKKLTIKKGKSKKLTVKGTGQKAVWSVVSGKKRISLHKKKKSSVMIKALKKGKAKIRAKIAGQKYTCIITVK